MIDIAPSHTTEAEARDIISHVPQRFDAAEIREHKQLSASYRFHWSRQVLRFSIVGGLNTLVDLFVLNSLLWLFPTTSTPTLLGYNALAFSCGAVDSFMLNKYWTFNHKQKTTLRELLRFTLSTLCGIGWSTLILWLASTLLHPGVGNSTTWANASKCVAIAGSAILSYLAMRLWVFARSPYSSKTATAAPSQAHMGRTNEQQDAAKKSSSTYVRDNERFMRHSLSVVLPIYNEEDAIADTLTGVWDGLKSTIADFEIIAVNDGSSDHTGDILTGLATTMPQVRVVTHEHNQGYGAALADGFATTTKELTLFMDADGQFDIGDLPHLLTFIDTYDAVIGYRQHRQDTWMRRLNAWGWKTLIEYTLGVHVRDIDCAFKLLRTDFLHHYAPRTRGAMINAELLHTLKQAGYTYREVAVHHLPRRGGRATGANPRVIARAFRELFTYVWMQRRRATPQATSTRVCQ